MRHTQAEKMDIIRLVEESEWPVKRTLDELGVASSTFYRWYDRYLAEGYDGLADRKAGPRQFWNRIPDEVRELVVEVVMSSILCKRALDIKSESGLQNGLPIGSR